MPTGFYQLKRYPLVPFAEADQKGGTASARTKVVAALAEADQKGGTASARTKVVAALAEALIRRAEQRPPVQKW